MMWIVRLGMLLANISIVVDTQFDFVPAVSYIVCALLVFFTATILIPIFAPYKKPHTNQDAPCADKGQPPEGEQRPVELHWACGMKHRAVCVPVMRADTGEHTEQAVTLQLSELFVETHAISDIELPIVDARAVDGHVLELSALFDVPDEHGHSMKVDPFTDEKKEDTTPDDASLHAKRLENEFTDVDGQIEVEHRHMEVELCIFGEEAIGSEGVGNVTSNASPHAKRIENAITDVDGQIEVMHKSDVDKQMEVEHRDMEVELSIFGQEAIGSEGVGNVTKEVKPIGINIFNKCDTQL